jgi:glycosyltransferase involved in cell wall biosynthesis
MKVCLQQFLGQNHSWSIVGQNIARALIAKGHEVHLQSTNGYEHFPADLEPFKREKLEKYDMQISYTAMHNFPQYLSHGVKNRFGLWNFETTVLPQGFAKYYKATDKMIPSSAFAKKVFVDNGVPDDHVVVVPHGINVEEYSTNEIYELKTKKKYKILANIAQPHVRKNINGLFEAYGKAFTKDDDVCLVVKVSAKKVDTKYVQPPIVARNKRAARKIKQKLEEVAPKTKKSYTFDVDFWGIYNNFRKQFPNHAEVEIIDHFLDSMVPLYNACDIVFSTTHAECFWLPGLEGMATNNLVIAPNWGGQLEYMNEHNSLLIDGEETRAPKKMQYWAPSPYAKTFTPYVEDTVAKLQLAVSQYDTLMEKFRPGMKEQLDRLTWGNVVDQIIGLCE